MRPTGRNSAPGCTSTSLRANSLLGFPCTGPNFASDAVLLGPADCLGLHHHPHGVAELDQPRLQQRRREVIGDLGPDFVAARVIVALVKVEAAPASPLGRELGA